MKHIKILREPAGDGGWGFRFAGLYAAHADDFRLRVGEMYAVADEVAARLAPPPTCDACGAKWPTKQAGERCNLVGPDPTGQPCEEMVCMGLLVEGLARVVEDQ